MKKLIFIPQQSQLDKFNVKNYLNLTSFQLYSELETFLQKS